MFKKINLFVLCSIAIAPLYAHMVTLNVSANSNGVSPLFPQPNRLKEAPQISSVRVLSLKSSSSNTEIIREGQRATVNHHSGTLAIITLEVGYARHVRAEINGNILYESETKRPMCADAQGALRECRGGEPAEAYIRSWTIKNFTTGTFTYQATSTNPPNHQESVRLKIN